MERNEEHDGMKREEELEVRGLAEEQIKEEKEKEEMIKELQKAEQSNRAAEVQRKEIQQVLDQKLREIAH